MSDHTHENRAAFFDDSSVEETTLTTTKKTRTPSSSLLPTVLWAQRRDRIFLTFEIKNAIRDSLDIEIANPYPVEKIESGEPFVGTSEVRLTCESFVVSSGGGGGSESGKICGEGGARVLMIDDCSVETVGEKLKRQGFGGEEEDESGHESVEKPRTPALTSPCQKTTDGIDGDRIENQPTHSSETSSPRSVSERNQCDPFPGAGREKQTHAIQLELYNAVLSTKISHKLNVTDKTIHLVLFKPKPTPHWPRLLATREKFRHVKTDFDAWKDEDEELEDENAFTFDAKKMLNIDQYEDAELFDDISSDDEDMPDLTEMV